MPSPSLKRTVLRGSVVVAVLAWMPSFQAHEHTACVEVNNISNNRLGIFELLGLTGELKRVEEVTTGGVGRNGGYISIPQIVSTPAVAGHACVFAANAATNDVTAFDVAIEKEVDTPCPCHNKAAGPPVSIGVGAIFGALGAGVAVTPDARTLYTLNPGSSDLSRFVIRRGCALQLVNERERTQAPPAPSDIQVKPDGRCVAVPSPVTDRVAMYRIGTGNELVRAGQFDVPGPGRATSVQFTRSVLADVLYVSKAASGQAVITRFDVDRECQLARPAVTAVTTGRMSSVAQLDPENLCLYAANHTVATLAVNHPPSTLSAFSVNPLTGSLAHVITVEDVAFYPAGMGFGRTYSGQRFLYYTSFTREIFRRPLAAGCLPGPVVRPGVPASENPTLPATGPLRTLTIVQ